MVTLNFKVGDKVIVKKTFEKDWYNRGIATITVKWNDHYKITWANNKYILIYEKNLDLADINWEEELK